MVLKAPDKQVTVHLLKVPTAGDKQRLPGYPRREIGSASRFPPDKRQYSSLLSPSVCSRGFPWT